MYLYVRIDGVRTFAADTALRSFNIWFAALRRDSLALADVRGEIDVRVQFWPPTSR